MVLHQGKPCLESGQYLETESGRKSCLPVALDIGNRQKWEMRALKKYLSSYR